MNKLIWILFIGNSLTYFNDLPKTVQSIAATAGLHWEVRTAAAPDVALIDHINGATDALTQLKSRKWDYVVLQQGPSTLGASRDSLILWTKMFDPLIRESGARPALFMPWPIDARWDRMHLVRETFHLAAGAVQGEFIPAGSAWLNFHEQYDDVALYGPDSFHPTPIGSFLAALTIYESISKQDARALPARAFVGDKELKLPVPLIRVLQQAAHEASSGSARAQSHWDSVALARARAYSDSIGSTAVMIVQDGDVISQWGDVTARTDVHSVRKSLLSSLIGIAFSRRQLDTAATLRDMGIDDAPDPLTDAERSARLVDLLTSRSGVYHPAAYETLAMAAQRPPRGSHPPGTFFYYNNWDFNALGTIYEKKTQHSIFDDFLELIARPIGMQDLRREDMRYHREPQSQHAAYLFSMSARDLARFGLLYLNNGQWEGRQVVPAEWVRWSTSPLADQGIRGGYGALWWVATDPNDPVIRVPVGTYSARGVGEQNVFVFPPWRLVIVHRGDPDNRPIRVQQFGRLLRLILASRR